MSDGNKPLRRGRDRHAGHPNPDAARLSDDKARTHPAELAVGKASRSWNGMKPKDEDPYYAIDA